MKGEIKEILDYFRKYMNIDDCIRLSKIEDCITDLKEELKSANDSITWWHNRFNSLRQENKGLKGKIKTLENNCQQAENSCRQHRLANKNHIRRLKRREKQINLYKSRNEKAINYIMTDLITEWAIENDGYVSGSDLPVDAITPLLNILQGDDKE